MGQASVGSVNDDHAIRKTASYYPSKKHRQGYQYSPCPGLDIEGGASTKPHEVAESHHIEQADESDCGVAQIAVTEEVKGLAVAKPHEEEEDDHGEWLPPRSHGYDDVNHGALVFPVRGLFP